MASPGWLNLLGPIELQANGTTVETSRPKLNFIGDGLTIEDNEANDSSDLTVPSGGSTAPAGTGLVTVSSGAFSTTVVVASGITTWFTTPSSANLLAALSDKTGTGVAVFGTSPTFTTSFKLASGAYAYAFSPGTIAANRTVTLPDLASNDTIVTQAHAQTLSNKTLTDVSLETANVSTAGPFDDYNVDGVTVLTVSYDGIVNFTGFQAPTNGKPKLLYLVCTNAGAITLSDEDAGSFVQNRISLGAFAPSTGGVGLVLMYIPTMSRWKIVSYPVT